MDISKSDYKKYKKKYKDLQSGGVYKCRVPSCWKNLETDFRNATLEPENSKLKTQT